MSSGSLLSSSQALSWLKYETSRSASLCRRFCSAFLTSMWKLVFRQGFHCKAQEVQQLWKCLLCSHSWLLSLRRNLKKAAKVQLSTISSCFLITNMRLLQELSPEAPGWILGHFSLVTNNDNYTKNGIKRGRSGKTEQTVLSRNNSLKKFRKTKVLVTSEIRAQRVRQQSMKLQRKKELSRQTILKKLSFQWRWYW